MAIDVTVVSKPTYVSPRKGATTARRQVRQVITLQSLRESYRQLCDLILAQDCCESEEICDLIQSRRPCKAAAFLHSIAYFVYGCIWELLPRIHTAPAQASIVIFQRRFTPLGFNIYNLPVAPPRT